MGSPFTGVEPKVGEVWVIVAEDGLVREFEVLQVNSVAVRAAGYGPPFWATLDQWKKRALCRAGVYQKRRWWFGRKLVRT